MRLITHTTRNFLILLFISLTIWGILFYRTVKPIIYVELDEYLLSRQNKIIENFKKNSQLLKLQNIELYNFTIEEVNQNKVKKIKQGYRDIKLFIPEENENEVFRELTNIFKFNDKYYKIRVISSLVDKHKVKNLIVFSTLVLQVLLLLIILFLNRKMLKNIWKPFYKLVSEIKNYRIDKHKTPSFEETNIDEFQLLNNTVKELLEKNHMAYLNQKNFIDNVSHEIKTPLAIIKNKTELLLQNKELAEDNAKSLSDIYEFVTKLNKISESLLLLSKIENNQFTNKNQVNLNKLIKEIIENHIEFIEFKNIKVEIKKNFEKILQLDETLCEILFKNLILNAINHNINSGIITIKIDKDIFTIENTGKPLNEAPESYFERFKKRSDNNSSTGLGLAIVKSICDINNFQTQYKVKENKHKITVNFQN